MRMHSRMNLFYDDCASRMLRKCVFATNNVAKVLNNASPKSLEDRQKRNDCFGLVRIQLTDSLQREDEGPLVSIALVSCFVTRGRSGRMKPTIVNKNGCFACIGLVVEVQLRIHIVRCC